MGQSSGGRDRAGTRPRSLCEMLLARHGRSDSSGPMACGPRTRRLASRVRAAWASLCLALVAVGCGAAGSGAVPADPAAPRVKFEYEHAAMGTLFRVTLYARDEATADAAAALALARIDAIESVATDYDAGSEARRLSTRAVGTWVPVSPDLALVLRAADGAVRRSEGAFDPTVGALTRHWRRALRNGEWPTQERWDTPRRRCGWLALVELRDVQGQLAIRLGMDAMRLDFGGIAKGVAVDEALRALEADGIHSALVDGGGDLAALDAPPGESGWRVVVTPFSGDDGPTLSFMLVRAAVATSGDQYQRAMLAGPVLEGIVNAKAQYGHVLDPRSGLPLAVPRAAVMTARSAAEADALATARLVLGEAVTGSLSLERGVFFGAHEGTPFVGRAYPYAGVTPIGRSAARDR